MMTKDESIKMFVPTFDGKRKNWRMFKAKFESYLAHKDMSLLLTWKIEVPKDDKTWSQEDLKKQENKDAKRIVEQNKKAAGLLLNCIDGKTDLGEAAFEMVHKFMDAAEGHAGGNFKKSWALMIRRYEKKDISTTATLKKDYYKLEMEEEELPSLFITKMER